MLGSQPRGPIAARPTHLSTHFVQTQLSFIEMGHRSGTGRGRLVRARRADHVVEG